MKLDTTGVQARMTNMVAEIAAMAPKIQQEFTAWQSEDMHRKHPESEVRGQSVATQVWRRGRPMVMLLKRSSPFSHPGHPFKGVRSTRPILRPVLVDQLEARMNALLRAIKW
jgi:hypothetical protein